jgi:predicted transcriptional regulator
MLSALDQWWEKYVRTNRIFITRREIRRMSTNPRIIAEIQEARADIAAGRVYTSEEVRAGLGLPPR